MSNVTSAHCQPEARQFLIAASCRFFLGVFLHDHAPVHPASSARTPQVQAATITALSSHLVALASTVAVQASNQAVLTNALSAQEGVTQALRRELLAQNATIVSQGSTILAQNSTIVSHGSTIAAQSTAIADSAEYPCILGDATTTTLHIDDTGGRRDIRVGGILRAVPWLSRCKVLVGTVWIEGSFDNSTMLSEAFGNVQVIAGELIIRRSGLRTLGSAFRYLTELQRIVIEHNDHLASLGSAFSSLQRVSVYTGSNSHGTSRGSVSISNNAALEALGPTAFANMGPMSVGGGLNFDRAGDQCCTAGTQRTAGSARFCREHGCALPLKGACG